MENNMLVFAYTVKMVPKKIVSGDAQYALWTLKPGNNGCVELGFHIRKQRVL